MINDVSQCVVKALRTVVRMCDYKCRVISAVWPSAQRFRFDRPTLDDRSAPPRS